MPAKDHMIRCRLLELMGRRGIRFLTRLSRETGINRKTLAVLAENRMERFDSQVLSRLCSFFECQPGDLLEYTRPADSRQLDPRSPCRTNQP